MTNNLYCGCCYYCTKSFFSLSSHQSTCPLRNDTDENIKKRHNQLHLNNIEILKNVTSSTVGPYIRVIDLFPDIPWLDKYVKHPTVKILIRVLEMQHISSSKVINGFVYWHKSIALVLIQKLSQYIYVNLVNEIQMFEYNPSISDLRNTIQHLQSQIEFLTRCNIESLNTIQKMKNGMYFEELELLVPPPIKRPKTKDSSPILSELSANHNHEKFEEVIQNIDRITDDDLDEILKDVRIPYTVTSNGDTLQEQLYHKQSYFKRHQSDMPYKINNTSVTG